MIRITFQASLDVSYINLLARTNTPYTRGCLGTLFIPPVPMKREVIPCV